MEGSENSALVCFGVIADTQYVDDEDGTAFDVTRIRRYRQSLQILKTACNSYVEEEAIFAVLLGDVLDGKAVRLNIAERCLQDVKSILESSNLPWHCLVGNHDLVALSKETLLLNYIPEAQRTQCSTSKLYYDFVAGERFRFIFLNAYGNSVFDTPEETLELLRSKNKNLTDISLDSLFPSNDYFEGISQENAKYVPFNGGIGAEQLHWLRSRLQEASSSGQKCLLFCHLGCLPYSCSFRCLLWDAEQLVEMMREFSDTVVAYFAGHDHTGGYAVDPVCGIPHFVLPAPLECEEGDVAYGHVRLYETYGELHWTGKVSPMVPESGLQLQAVYRFEYSVHSTLTFHRHAS